LPGSLAAKSCRNKRQELNARRNRDTGVAPTGRFVGSLRRFLRTDAMFTWCAVDGTRLANPDAVSRSENFLTFSIQLD